jgi:hypothetical protein
MYTDTKSPQLLRLSAAIRLIEGNVIKGTATEGTAIEDGA